MSNINIGKAPPNSAVLPFYATAAVAFWMLCLLLLAGSDSFTEHYFNPHTLAVVHTAALGWGTMIVFGAAYQLLPVICERDLFSPVLASLCWYLLTPGVVLLVYSFWTMQVGALMITGGSLVLLSVMAYFINVVFTSRVCTHYATERLFVVSSAFWLLFTVVAGLLLAVNLRYPVFKKNHLDLLKLHAHAGLAGWFLQLITGISSKLVPMFLLGRSGRQQLLKYAFVFQNAGLILFILDGFYFDHAPLRMAIYAALVITGIICWMRYIYDVFRNRVRKKTDLLMKQTFLSFWCLAIAIMILPFVLFAGNYRWSIVYGTFLFMGWITGIILGKTFKTLPFIVWNARYKDLSGKVKVPLPKNLFSEALVRWQFIIFIVAIIVLTAGMATGIVIVIQAGAGFWLLLASLYLFNVVKVLLHKTTVLS